MPRRPVPPPPATTSAAAAAPAATTVEPVITTATTEAQATGGKKKKGGKQPIGEGGFKADLSIGNSLDRLIQQNLTDRLEGRKTTFSEDVVDAMKEKLFRETQGQTRRGRMALMADAARRGVFRSEATGSLIRDIELAGLQQYSSGVKDILLQKAMKDHEDMTTAIGQSQQWLQGLRQYALGLEQNAIAREQVKATLAAAAMQASASRYAADQALKGAQAAAGASRYAANMAYNAQRAVDSSGNYIGTMTMSQYEFAARNGT